MVLDGLLQYARISPRTSPSIFFESPRWPRLSHFRDLLPVAVRCDAIDFTFPVRSFQTPVTSHLRLAARLPSCRPRAPSSDFGSEQR